MEPNMKWTNEHPVSNVVWVESSKVHANDYNPNTVAPPEMELLKLSIESDGFTQPIVVWETKGEYEVVDGFHRHIVGKQIGLTHLPVVIVNRKTNKGDRIASTIRHNRARGKHSVSGMSDVVIDLSRRNWSDEKIGKELGMEQDEVLRLKQVPVLRKHLRTRNFQKHGNRNNLITNTPIILYECYTNSLVL